MDWKGTRGFSNPRSQCPQPPGFPRDTCVQVSQAARPLSRAVVIRAGKRTAEGWPPEKMYCGLALTQQRKLESLVSGCHWLTLFGTPDTGRQPHCHRGKLLT